MSLLEDTFELQLRAAKIAGFVREYRFAPPRKFRADFCWPMERVIAEVEGGTHTFGRHNRPKGFEADCEKYNVATTAGWKVLRFTGAMVKDGRALATVEEALKPTRMG